MLNLEISSKSDFLPVLRTLEPGTRQQAELMPIEQPTHVINYKPELDQNAYLEKYGLNWTVYKDPLLCGSDGKKSGSVATRRSDNHYILGTVGEGYEPFMNHEMMILTDAACQETGIVMHNAGCLAQGELVYIQAHSGQVEIGRDKIEKYITVLNSHNGRTSLKWGLSNITVVCRNTFFGAFRQLENSASHTANMRDKIRSMVKGITNARAEEKSLYDTFSRMAEKPLDLKAIEAVTTSVLDLDSLDELKLKDISTRKKNLADRFAIVLENEIASHGKTYWGALSAATYWTTHEASAKERAASKMSGPLHTIDSKAFTRLSNILN